MREVRLDASDRTLAVALGEAVPRLGEQVEIVGLEPQRGNGFSSDTWFCTARARSGPLERLVLRLAPQGQAVFPTYDLGQEHRILRALVDEGFPVPRSWMYDAEPGGFERDILVMEHVDGVTAKDVPVYTSAGWLLEMAPAAQRNTYVSSLELLARLHGIDPQRHDLGGLRRLDGPDREGGSEFAYYRRYAEWVGQPRDTDVVGRAERWLLEHMPAGGERVLNWGDAKLSNVVFDDHRDPISLLDWEMAFLGPPEADLGFWLVYDTWATEGLGFPRVPGFPDREETLALYEGFTGRSVRHLHYFEVWAAYRLVLIQIRLDHLLRSTADRGPKTPVFGPGIEILDRLLGGSESA